MELNELMEIDVKNLAKKQAEYLEAHIISKLEQAISHVKSHDFISLAIMTSYSPAGDGYGCENNFIDFRYSKNQDDGLDILEVSKILENLLERSE